MEKRIELTPEEFGKVNEVVSRFVQSGTVSTEPVMVIVTGPIASGKTTIRREKYSQGYTLIDSGELMDAYKDEVASEEKLEGLLMVTGTELVRRAVTEKRNIVIEITADTPEKAKRVEEITDKMTSLGYKVEIEYVDCDAEECQRRNEKGRDNVSSYYSSDETLHYFLVYFTN